MGTLRVCRAAALASLLLAGPAGAATYVNEAFGWRLEAPEGWIVSDADPAFVEFSPVGARAGAILGVQSGESPDEQLRIVSLLFVGGWKRSLAASGATVEVTRDAQETRLGGEPALVTEARVEGARSGRARIVVLRAGTRVFVLVAEGTDADWRRYGAEIDAAIASFGVAAQPAR